MSSPPWQLFWLFIVLGSCGPSPEATSELISAGDERACATREVKEGLQERLTPFLSYRKIRSATPNGQNLKNAGFIFDPIITVSKEEGSVRCGAGAYISLDGRTPFASNTIEVFYTLTKNLSEEDGFIIAGDFSEAQNTTRLLYENAGFVD